MHTHWKFALAAMSAMALSACGGGEDEPTAREGVLVSGSSTVYPFSQAVAEATMAANPDMAPIRVESTGTSDGIAAFCAGTGLDTPDIADASRRMTLAEFRGCQANGVTEIVELRVGTDGIVFVSSLDGGLSMNLTKPQIYRALAAEPYGDEQTATNWSDVDGSLPEQGIVVYGPPESSGTRTSLRELVLAQGCAADSRMGGLEISDAERFEEVCSTLRTDGAYLPQGEDDDLIVRKVANNPLALAVVGYSWFEENQTQVQAISIDGVAPDAESIGSGRYPASRPLYIYIKKAHLEQVAGLQAYIDQWVASWGPGGALEGIGLVVSPEADLAAAAAAASAMTLLTEADLAEPAE